VRLALLERLRDDDDDTREEAIFALAQLGDSGRQPHRAAADDGAAGAPAGLNSFGRKSASA
jgi:HEAT repeat protein